MQISNRKSVNFLLFVFAIQFIMGIMVVLDVPIARQVIGFLYLTLIPGIIILKILKLDNLDSSETILFSVGLSIAFLMLIGLLTNELSPLIGVSKPLSLAPLMMVINTVVFLLCLLSCIINTEGFNITFTEISKSSLTIVPFILLPFLSVIGAMFVNVSRNNFVLLLMIITVSVLIILSVLSKKLVPSRFYPLALLMIAIAILFHGSLISNYICHYGSDVLSEYYIFSLTENNSRWNSTIVYKNPGYTRVNAMLSVTILTSIYSNILNMNVTWTFKIMYPLVFSFVPLGLYQLYKTKVSNKVAFLSTFLFMAYDIFFTEMLGLTRQMVAELFYVLLFFVLLNKKIDGLRKSVCFMLFSFALVVSHYATSYVFMFLILFTWVSLFFLKKIRWARPKTRRITLGLVMIFFVISFSWYIYVSSSGSFNTIVSVGDNIYRSMAEFFNPGSRGQGVLRGLGMDKAPSFWNLISRIFAYATEFFIVIGFIVLIIHRRKMIFDQEHTVLISLNMAILAMCIILPNFAESLNMTRFYHILLFFLAPLCILGGEAFFRFVAKTKRESHVLALLLIVLIPYFLFQTGFIYEVTGSPSWSVPLSGYRMDLITYSKAGLIDEQEVFSAKWLSENIDITRTLIYVDIRSYGLIISYGTVHPFKTAVLSNSTTVMPNEIVYLSQINVINGSILGRRNMWNTTEISSILNDMNKIYSNGGCEIYKKY